MAAVKEVKFEIKRTPSKSGSIKQSPVLSASVKKDVEKAEEDEIHGMKAVNVSIKPAIKLTGDSPKPSEANNLKKHGVLSEINSFGNIGKPLKHSSVKKKLDSPNIIREKKISNLEREKLLNKGLSDDIKDLKDITKDEKKVDEKDGKMITLDKSEKELDDVTEDSNSVIMELENVLSFEDESGAESDTASVRISHIPKPDTVSNSSSRSTEDVPSTADTDTVRDTGNVKQPSGFVSEKGSMMEELQKFLHNKYGPIVSEPTVTETHSVKKDSDSATKTETTSTLNSEEKTVDSKPVTRVPVFPVPQHPIFFKTSIKKDPGSKLHDALVSELQTVLRKRDGSDDKTGKGDTDRSETDADKTKERKFPIRRISAKGNPLLGNKALLAKFEDQLNRTLHKHKVFQRQRLKVLDLETVEINAESDGSLSTVGSPGLSSPTDTGFPQNLDKNTVDTSANADKVAVESKDSTTGNGISQRNSKPIKGDHTIISATSDKSSHGENKPENKTENPTNEEDELFVYAYKHPSGRTEGYVCSIERRKTTKDSRGKLRKYLTCINITTDGKLEGCPFTQDVDDGGLPTASGSGLYFAEEDKTANFNVEVGKRRGEIRVSVSGPNSIAKCSVDPVSDGSSYNVTYIPVETGIFDINVTWNGQDIPGSPYHPKVVDVRKVRVIGGWQHFMDTNERVNLVVGEKKQLPFDCSEAGPGSLRAEVQGPSRAIDVDIDTHMIGRTVVEFTPEEEGSHYIHLFWSDLPLVSSPFHGYAVQHTPDASKLILTGRGLKEATVREEAEFYIDGSQAGPGTPDVVLSGVRAEVDVRCVSVGNGKFRCTYVPTIPGAYLLHITWNGRQLRGSPYKVNIIGAFYPNRVVVTGEGLRGGMLGREMSVQIDTRKAGPGELTAYCMGPAQVAYCELQDNQDGTFKLGVRPQEAGRHVLQIKYGGEHVQNSPFAFKVTSQPDASKVRVSGPGVEHGILATFMSRFIVETRGAGAGQLTVRIRGPKGAFQVEMYRDSQRDRTILCRYDPTECGLYIVSVKWSGVDVPGSPFHIHICDTQEELEHMLNEVSYSMGSHGTGSHPSQFVSTSSQPRMVYGQWREQL